MTDASDTTDNPFFARLWTFLSSHETEEIQRLRTENLAGLSGRVLEVGAGTGTNFGLLPDNGDRGGRRRARATAGAAGAGSGGRRRPSRSP